MPDNIEILSGCDDCLTCPKVILKDGNLWIIGYSEFDAEVFRHVGNGEVAVLVPEDIVLEAAQKLSERAQGGD